MQPNLNTFSDNAFDRVVKATKYTENLMRANEGTDWNQKEAVNSFVQVRMLSTTVDQWGMLEAEVVIKVDYPQTTRIPITASTTTLAGSTSTSTSSTTSTTTTSTSTTSTTTTCRPGTTTLGPKVTTTLTPPGVIYDVYRIIGKCWVIELNGSRLGLGCVFHGQVSCTWDGRAVILVQSNDQTADCTNPVSSVTDGCSGQAKWSWDNGSAKSWTLLENCCSVGCNPVQPTYCPESACGVVYTGCGKGSYQEKKSCTTTTTLPPGTTIPPIYGPGCPCECIWNAIPTIGWELTDIQCDPAFAGCNDITSSYCKAPSDIPNCQTNVRTKWCCPVIVTLGCTGSCQWIAGPIPGTWYSLDNTNPCKNGLCSCKCARPSFVSACGTIITTPCEDTLLCGTSSSTVCGCSTGGRGICKSTESDPCPDGSYPPTGPGGTTTIPPNCRGNCVYKWSSIGGVWNYSTSNCPGCQCSPPTRNGKVDCELYLTPCFPNTTKPPTTSTTSTTPPPTTTSTTTLPPCGECGWITYYIGPPNCYGPWQQTSTCTDSSCICYGPSVIPDCSTSNSATLTYVGTCARDIPRTTTTLPPSTTTSTTTTSVPCDGSCLYQYSDDSNGCCKATLTDSNCYSVGSGPGGGCACVGAFWLSGPCSPGTAGTSFATSGCIKNPVNPTRPSSCSTTTTTTNPPSTTTVNPSTTAAPGGGSTAIPGP